MVRTKTFKTLQIASVFVVENLRIIDEPSLQKKKLSAHLICQCDESGNQLVGKTRKEGTETGGSIVNPPSWPLLILVKLMLSLVKQVNQAASHVC